jgi:hypothetical protein
MLGYGDMADDLAVPLWEAGPAFAAVCRTMITGRD